MITVETRTLLAKSCARCHEFKQACEFAFIRGRYYDAWCKKCHQKNTGRHRYLLQEKSRDDARKHRQEWTMAELHELTVLYTEGFGATAIAKKLGRTTTSIYNMRNKLKEELLQSTIYTDEE